MAWVTGLEFRDSCIGQHSKKTSQKSEHGSLGQVSRRKKERFCDWVGNWVRGIDEDHSPIAPKECCSSKTAGALSPTLAFVRVHYQSSMSLWISMQSQRQVYYLLGMGIILDTPSLPSRLWALEKCSLKQDSDKGLTDVDQQWAWTIDIPVTPPAIKAS